MKKRKKSLPRFLPTSFISGIVLGTAILILALAIHSSFFSSSLPTVSKPEVVPNLLNLSSSNISSPSPTIASTPTPTTKASSLYHSSTKRVSSPAYIPQSQGNQLRVPILMYHYISSNPDPADRARDSLATPPDKFDEQLKYLSDNGYTTLTLDTLYAALKNQVTLPSKPIILTFDDGYIDFFINAYPILQKYRFQAMVFIPTGLMNQGYYLQWDQIRQMHGSGLIKFGAHSVHHYHLTSLSRQAALWEMAESKKVLQEKLGVPINFMAYPSGAANLETIDLAKEAGYIGSVGTWRGYIQSEGTIFNMPRIRINGFIDIKTFTELL